MMRVWAAAGGTGGHLYPALAVMEELGGDRAVTEWHFATSRRGLEADVLERMHVPFTALATEGLHRREVFRNLLFPFRAVAGLFQSLAVVKRLRPHVAFGTGGFVSGPALLAARMLGVPVVLLALDARPGVTIRLLAPIARRVFITTPQARSWLRIGVPTEVVGTPVRGPEPIDPRVARHALGLPRSGRLLFVTGGSQGSKLLNDTVAEALAGLLEVGDLSVLWQTGADHLADARAAVEQVLDRRPAYDRPRVKVTDYLNDIGLAWSAADLCVCRAGASTVAELARYGVPALLVPLATAAGGHQEANARAMERAGAARVLLEDELDPTGMTDAVRGLLAADGLVRMSTAAAKLAHAGAAHRIAEGLLEVADGLTEEERTAVSERLGRVLS